MTWTKKTPGSGLRTKVDRLQKEVDFIAKDRYALVRDKYIPQNKLRDFSSWPEFRIKYDQLPTEFKAMKRQRAREHISHKQILLIAREAKLELATAKRVEAMRKIAHREELKLEERDKAKEKYQTVLTTTTIAAATIYTTIASTTAAEGNPWRQSFPRRKQPPCPRPPLTNIPLCQKDVRHRTHAIPNQIPLQTFAS